MSSPSNFPTERTFFNNPYSIFNPLHYFHNLSALTRYVLNFLKPQPKAPLLQWTENQVTRTVPQNFTKHELKQLKSAYRKLQRYCLLSGLVSILYFNRKAHNYGIFGVKARLQWTFSSFVIGYLAPVPWVYVISIPAKWKAYYWRIARDVRTYYPVEREKWVSQLRESPRVAPASHVRYR